MSSIKNVVEICKSGNFYHTFGNDAIIIHTLLGYRIVKEKGGVGFPQGSLNKVINTLEENKISYRVFNKQEIVKEQDFKNVNKYNEILKKGLDKLDLETRFQRIEDKIKTMNNDELNNLLKVIEDAI